ncbi:MAG: hypothetical protein P1U74_11410 [Legionellaceae bacterium]|nr:hypothetical protein [Legionellaceae bacterium]
MSNLKVDLNVEPVLNNKDVGYDAHIGYNAGALSHEHIQSEHISSSGTSSSFSTTSRLGGYKEHSSESTSIGNNGYSHDQAKYMKVDGFTVIGSERSVDINKHGIQVHDEITVCDKTISADVSTNGIAKAATTAAKGIESVVNTVAGGIKDTGETVVDALQDGTEEVVKAISKLDVSKGAGKAAAGIGGLASGAASMAKNINFGGIIKAGHEISKVAGTVGHAAAEHGPTIAKGAMEVVKVAGSIAASMK